jgi:hypothetical protein
MLINQQTLAVNAAGGSPGGSSNIGNVGHLYVGGLPGYPYFGGYPGYGGYPYNTGLEEEQQTFYATRMIEIDN